MNQIPFLQSIRGKMTLANGAIVVALVGISVLATIQFVKVAELVGVVSDGSELLMHLSHVLDEREALQQAFQRGYAEHQDNAAQSRFVALIDDLSAHAASAQALSASPQESELMKTGHAGLTGARKRAQELAALAEEEREVAAIEIEEQLNDAMNAFASAKLSANKGMEARLATVKLEVKKPIRVFWSAALAGVAVALLASWFLRRRVSAPIFDLSSAVAELGRGQARQIQVTTQDELGQLASGFNHMAATITERTRSLKLVLDSVGDGLISCDRRGYVTGEPSLRALAWFGPPRPEVAVWEYLAGHDAKLSAQFALGFSQLAEDFLPFELCAYQMPRELERDGRTYALSYRQVIEDEEFRRLLIVVSDVTEQRNTARKEREQRDIYSLASLALGDPDAYADFCADVEKRLGRAVMGEHVMFELHTVKGNAGVVGCELFAQHVHDVETLMSEEGFRPEPIRELVRRWDTLCETAERAVGRSAAEVIVVPRPEYDRLLRLLSEAARQEDARSLAASWSMHRVGSSLTRLAKTAQRYAEREGKELAVSVQGGEFVVRRGMLDEFWGCLVHLVKNAVAHGIEPADRRLESGKAREGSIALAAEVHAGQLTVMVGDDGAGIDWDALKARDASGASGFELLTRGGVSTAAETTDLAGRGVGVAAMAKIVAELGGQVEVESEKGRGTTFKVQVPIGQGDAYAPKHTVPPADASGSKRSANG